MKNKVQRQAEWVSLCRSEQALKVALGRDDSREATRAAKRVEESIKQLPQLSDTARGHQLLALVAEARLNWKDAARHTRLHIAHMAFMRELARTERALARRAILRDYSSVRMAAAYRQLALYHGRAGAEHDARVARQQASEWARTAR